MIRYALLANSSWRWIVSVTGEIVVWSKSFSWYWLCLLLLPPPLSSICEESSSLMFLSDCCLHHMSCHSSSDTSPSLSQVTEVTHRHSGLYHWKLAKIYIRIPCTSALCCLSFLQTYWRYFFQSSSVSSLADTFQCSFPPSRNAVYTSQPDALYGVVPSTRYAHHSYVHPSPASLCSAALS